MSREAITRILGGLLAAAVVLAPAAAWAQTVTTIQGGDDRLYVRQITRQVSRGGAAWGQSGGAASYYSGDVSQLVVTKGDIIISDERFFQLLTMKPETRYLGQTFQKRALDRGLWTWGPTLGGSALFLACFYLDQASPVPNNAARVIGVTSMAAATAGAFVLYIDLLKPPRHFTTEEAVDAVDLYNRAL